MSDVVHHFDRWQLNRLRILVVTYTLSSSYMSANAVASYSAENESSHRVNWEERIIASLEVILDLTWTCERMGVVIVSLRFLGWWLSSLQSRTRVGMNDVLILRSTVDSSFSGLLRYFPSTVSQDSFEMTWHTGGTCLFI